MVIIVDLIKDIPGNFKKYFEQFIEIFTTKSFWEGNAKIEIIEIGPREENNTTFQLLPATNMEVKFPVLFNKTSSGTEVSFNLDIKLITGSDTKSPKLGKKMLKARLNTFEAGLNNQLSMLIKMALDDLRTPLEGQIDETKETDPLKILKLQLVKGEISEDEYIRKKNILEG